MFGDFKESGVDGAPGTDSNPSFAQIFEKLSEQEP